ncbi:protein unc-93 homolog A-like [Glandiceps talaboti]
MNNTAAGMVPLAEAEMDRMVDKTDEFHEGDSDTTITITDKSLWKNVLCASLSFFCTFSAFQGLQGLQSNLNCIEGLGFASLVTLYITSIVSGLFLASFITEWLGNKQTMIWSPACYVVYTLANFYPQWYTMIPASIIVGVGTSLLWTAQPSYMETMGQLLAQNKGKSSDVMINKVMAVLTFSFFLGSVTAFIPATIIFRGRHDSNTNDTSMSDIDSYTCGASDCQQTEGNVTTYCNPPDKHLTYILLGIYVALGLAAVGIVIFFVDDLERQHSLKPKGQKFKDLGKTIRLWFNRNMMMLIPISLLNGMHVTFISGDFPKSYISCAIGVDMVGYIFMCYGTTSMLVQVLASKMANTSGRVIMMVVAFTCLLSCYILLLVMEPEDNTLTLALFFLIAVLSGAADSIVMLESATMHALVFPNMKEAAFANKILWTAAGFSIGFALSLFLCVYIKISILIIISILAFISYFILEFKHHQEVTKGHVKVKSEN